MSSLKRYNEDTEEWEYILAGGGGGSGAPGGGNRTIQFNNDGELDGDDLFVYSEEGNLGVGADSPSARLSITGSEIDTSPILDLYFPSMVDEPDGWDANSWDWESESGWRHNLGNGSWYLDFTDTEQLSTALVQGNRYRIEIEFEWHEPAGWVNVGFGGGGGPSIENGQSYYEEVLEWYSAPYIFRFNAGSEVDVTIKSIRLIPAGGGPLILVVNSAGDDVFIIDDNGMITTPVMINDELEMIDGANISLYDGAIRFYDENGDSTIRIYADGRIRDFDGNDGGDGQVLSSDEEGRLIWRDASGGGGGDGYWAEADPETIEIISGITGIAFNDSKIYYRQAGDLNHSMGWGYDKHGIDGPVLNGYTGGGFAMGDANSNADTLVGEWRSDGLYSMGEKVLTEDDISNTTFIFNSSTPAEGHRYNDWYALIDATLENPGYKEIRFEQNETIPAGVWDVTDVSFFGNRGVSQIGTAVTVTFTEDASFVWTSPTMLIDAGLRFHNASSSSPISVGDFQVVVVNEASSLTSETMAPVLLKTGSDVSVLTIRDSVLGEESGGLPAIQINGGFVSISILGSSQIWGNSIGGSGGTAYISIQTISGNLNPSQPSFAGILFPDFNTQATLLGYDNSSSGLSANTVQAAIDELAILVNSL